MTGKNGKKKTGWRRSDEYERIVGAMTFREAIEKGEKSLKYVGIMDAKTDAWLLLTMACKIDHTYYYMHMDEDMTQEQAHEFASLIDKRCERIPLQYITGEQIFMGLPFTVNSNVLIPRQDTETLVEEALKIVKPEMKILDMCTGSGCVLISILKNVVNVEGYGYDISKQAIIVAKENAKKNGVTATFEHSDLFENVSEKFDIIVSNPPYIRTDELHTLMPEVAEFEPRIALDGKEDGLYYYRKMIAECTDYLKLGGYLLFEIGHDQGRAVSDMMTYARFEKVNVVKDLAGNDRVVIGEKNYV